MSSRPGLLPSLIIVLVVFGAMGGFLFLFYRYDPPKIAVVVMAPGFGDLSMADQAGEGLSGVAAPRPGRRGGEDASRDWGQGVAPVS